MINTPATTKSALIDYIDAWRRHDIAGVLATLTDDCVIIESYGPVYRGTERLEQWMKAWFAAGGVVKSWDVTAHTTSDDLELAEWTFACIWKEEDCLFDGATIARLDDDRISHLREYATTAPLYDWTGTWR